MVQYASGPVTSDDMNMMLARVRSVLPPDCGHKYERLVSEIVKHNDALGLVAKADEKEILRRHLLDSLLGLRVLDALFPRPTTVLDVGTGGGFPGLTLAIARPEWSFVLVDSSRKKVGFLLKLIQLLKLNNARTLRGRAEDLAGQGVDVCTARAVAPMKPLVHMTAHLPRPGGVFCWWKGPAAVDEIQQAADSLAEKAVRIIGRYPYKLPSDGIGRSIVLAQKTS